jgi:hypothetical protein
VEAARTNKIKVVDIDNKPVHAAVWHRRGIVIDLNTSDLYDGVDGRVLLRRNLYFVDPQLRVAAEASIAHHRDGLPPPPPMPPVYPKSELWKQIEEHVAPAAVAIIEANQTPLRESNTAETEHKNSGGAPLGIGKDICIEIIRIINDMPNGLPPRPKLMDQIQEKFPDAGSTNMRGILAAVYSDRRPRLSGDKAIWVELTRIARTDDGLCDYDKALRILKERFPNTGEIHLKAILTEVFEFLRKAKRVA